MGLEIHAELKTKTKMFCSCKNDPDEAKPNTNVCPICLAHPGSLPTINKQAVEHVVRVGIAQGGTIADFTEFDRKHYFYPDIPKGYQISQYKYPIVSGGELAGMEITRIHLEEDTANNKHDRGDFSLVDFNRAGVPLMELVTEPHTFPTPEEAASTGAKFAKEFQLLLRYLDVSEANMEKGEMRVEANISLSDDANNFGTKVEVKNLNSFRSVERAIKYELDRMQKLLEAGKGSDIVQETRGWDEGKQSTFSQRSKENAQEYRYFPDPDLPKMKLSEVFDLEAMRSALPELPNAKKVRYKNVYGIKDEDIDTYILDRTLATWFESVAAKLIDVNKIKIASNYITSDFIGLKKNNPKVTLPTYEHFAELIDLVTSGQISSRAAKDILAMIVVEDASPLAIATDKGLLQSNDEGALTEIIKKIIAENPDVVATYKGGKENALMSLVGKVIKASNGSANPAITIKLLKEILG
ncbi:Asp-tRNA(Asn)/Glu-tRNA(Gln) amidotransferase subunit GatB [Candidatus Nomurabacteria bacterium]|nr:MAG: Asp-tRNA(Asn)/Glu-tRNA(Gln) amidotransferase subunit GatB [Candidatus Nomurabacteria bacterium]